MTTSQGEVTALLHAMRDGDQAASEKLLPLVYTELHRLARSYMRKERVNHTLQPTALINEAYLRLAHALLLATCFGPLRRFNLAHPWNVEF
jgi:hypothetical protein